MFFTLKTCVFLKTKLTFFENSNVSPLLGLRILPLFEDFDIDLDVIHDITVSDTHPYS